MQKIGILGGTFNPIHIGHLVMGETARERLGLDKVLFIPSWLPPHKSAQNVAAAKQRLQMVRLAISGNPFFEVCDCEIKRKGKSYSVDTVQELKKQYPSGTTFFFIIGQDSLAALRTWRRIDELLKMVSFVVMNRPGFTKPRTKIKTRFLTMPSLDISSSEIRTHIRSSQSVRYLVTPEVFAYIQKHKLYQ